MEDNFLMKKSCKSGIFMWLIQIIFKNILGFQVILEYLINSIKVLRINLEYMIPNLRKLLGYKKSKTI